MLLCLVYHHILTYSDKRTKSLLLCSHSMYNNTTIVIFTFLTVDLTYLLIRSDIKARPDAGM